MEKKREKRAARYAPVLCLLVLAPWVGEFLLGNSPLGNLPGLPLIVPMYGGGALMVREAVYRTGRGWPAIFLLGAAYGVIEAGLVDQSLFNRNFEHVSHRDQLVIPPLGIDAYNAQAFVIGHAVWSIAVPIALAGMLWPARRTEPWLGRAGFAVTAALYAAGCALVFRMIGETEQFVATPGQWAGAGAAALVLVIAAFLTGKKSPAADPSRTGNATDPAGSVRTGNAPFAAGSARVENPARAAHAVEAASPVRGVVPPRRRVPGPRLLGFGSFAAASLFMMRAESRGGVLFGFALLGVAAALVLRWSRQPGWDVRHELALTAGAVLTYAWLGFVLTLLLRPGDATAWIGNVLFAPTAVGLLPLANRRIRLFRPAREPQAEAVADAVADTVADAVAKALKETATEPA